MSIHHLDDMEKNELFYCIYEALPAGGIFVNYDLFCAGTPMMNRWFDLFWEKQLYNSGSNWRKSHRNGEHWFHTDEQMKVLDNWVCSSIR